MIRRPPRSTLDRSSAASDVYKRQRLANASQIIAVDISEPKLEMARRFGATDDVDASEADPVQRIREMTGGGVDYAFEALGTGATVTLSLIHISEPTRPY